MNDSKPRNIMQSKRLLFSLGYFFVAAVAFFLGFTKGTNNITKAELNVSIPVYVEIYQKIKQGETNGATTLIGMVLDGKISRYDSLRTDTAFRLTQGDDLFTSPKLEKYVPEARAICLSEKTNIVVVRP